MHLPSDKPLDRKSRHWKLPCHRPRNLKSCFAWNHFLLCFAFFRCWNSVKFNLYLYLCIKIKTLLSKDIGSRAKLRFWTCLLLFTNSNWELIHLSNFQNQTLFLCVHKRFCVTSSCGQECPVLLPAELGYSHSWSDLQLLNTGENCNSIPSFNLQFKECLQRCYF